MCGLYRALRLSCSTRLILYTHSWVLAEGLWSHDPSSDVTAASRLPLTTQGSRVRGPQSLSALLPRRLGGCPGRALMARSGRALALALSVGTWALECERPLTMADGEWEESSRRPIIYNYTGRDEESRRVSAGLSPAGAADSAIVVSHRWALNWWDFSFLL